ncbi:MAG TPA: hypothetical protein DCS63_02835 [Elusimicrobia bacterium]|nr:hypothetical protein [Elusimicrobiota bacterium]
MNYSLKKALGAAALSAACAALPFSISAGDELARARLAEAGSRSSALDIAFSGLNARPVDRELFLYAVELTPEGPSKYAAALDGAARAMLKGGGEDYAWYLGLCKALRCAARAQEAVPNCKRALELDPTAAPVYRELGLTYAAAGSQRKAAETLEQGVELSSADYKAHYSLAKVLEARGDPRAARYYAGGLALALRGRDPDAGYYAGIMKAGLERAERKKKTARVKPPAVQTRAAKETAAECLKEVKAELSGNGHEAALRRSDACLKLSPADPALAAERAPLLVRLGKYEDGVKEYMRAASLYAGKASLAAFYRIKAAETWLKLGNSSQAIAQYLLALASNPGDLNALKGLAAALDARSDTGRALEIYATILKLDPSNDTVRTRSEELKAGLLTSDQMLEELRLRAAIDPARTSLQPEDIKLFKAIKSAELGGAVDYLKEKAPSAKGFTVRRDGQGAPRLALTGAGYKAYLFHATKDAVKFFEGRGIGLREIFNLRDLAGAPVFDPAGRLTPEGDEARRKAAAGEKTWLLPYEPVPTNPQAIQAAKGIAEAEQLGYREISEPEYLWLMKTTTCPDDVLKAAPLNVREFKDGTRARYLLCYVTNGLCMNESNMKLPQFIEQYRNNELDTSAADSHTGFFGAPGAKKRHFCENGKIWTGE